MGLETKEELAAEITKLLGVGLDSLMRMTLEDLKVLRNVLSRGPEQGQFLGAVFHRPLKDVLNEKILDKSLGELSLTDILGMEDKGSGILGLGVLPRLRSMVQGDKKQT